MGIWTYLLVLSLISIILVYIYYKRALTYWLKKGVKQIPASFPFGSASKLFLRKTSLGELLREIYKEYRAQGLSFVGFYLCAKPVLIILDIDLIKSVLLKDFHNFTSHGSYCNEKNDPMTGNLFFLKGQKWKDLRTKLSPAFTTSKIKTMFHIFVDCSSGMKEIMDEIVKMKKAVNMKDVSDRYAIDVIASCAFGLESNSLKDPKSEIRKVGKKTIDAGFLNTIYLFLALFSPELLDFMRLKLFDAEVRTFIMKVVTKNINYRLLNNINRKDFMHSLIQLKYNHEITDDKNLDDFANQKGNNTKEGLTTDQIAAQFIIFLLAGYETSSTTLSFCLFELAANSDIQKELRNEIQIVLSNHGGQVSYDAINQMSLMDRCIQETLRKYPPLPFLFRECTEEYIIPGTNVVIEKGTLVFIPVLGIHYNPDIYNNPEKFYPDRFTTEGVASRDNFTWLPFGEGPRNCIASRFGLTEIKVALVVLLKSYEFTLNGKTRMPIVINKNTPNLTAVDGIWLDVKEL